MATTMRALSGGCRRVVLCAVLVHLGASEAWVVPNVLGFVSVPLPLRWERLGEGAAAGEEQTDVRDTVQRALSAIQQPSGSASRDPEQAARAALQIIDADPDLRSSGWLRAPLGESPPDLDTASARLMEAAALVEPVTGRVAPSDARGILAQILDGPPFQAFTWLSALPSWLLPIALAIGAIGEVIWRIVRWPFDRLLDLLGGVLGGPAVLALAALAIAAIVWLYRAALRSAIVRQAEIAPPPTELPPTAAEALALAQRRSAEGRYREACHFLFLSTLLWIEERGQARFDPSATNREHLARVGAQPSLAGALRPMVARFDHLWYGQDAVTDTDYQDLLALARRLREATA